MNRQDAKSAKKKALLIMFVIAFGLFSVLVAYNYVLREVEDAISKQLRCINFYPGIISGRYEKGDQTPHIRIDSPLYFEVHDGIRWPIENVMISNARIQSLFSRIDGEVKQINPTMHSVKFDWPNPGEWEFALDFFYENGDFLCDITRTFKVVVEPLNNG